MSYKDPFLGETPEERERTLAQCRWVERISCCGFLLLQLIYWWICDN